MEAETDPLATDQLLAENQQLRASIAELEEQLSAQSARTNEIVAQTQERIYWLDRWHIDLDKLLRVPGVSQGRALLRAIRAPFRLLKKAARKLP